MEWTTFSIAALFFGATAFCAYLAYLLVIAGHPVFAFILVLLAGSMRFQYKNKKDE